jgi:hypothetical protein
MDTQMDEHADEVPLFDETYYLTLRIENERVFEGKRSR